RIEQLKWGTFVRGRRGMRSRIVFRDSVPASSVVVAARAVDEDAHPVKECRHDYILRPGYRVAVVLPEDLTDDEAARLSHFVRGLSFQTRAVDLREGVDRMKTPEQFSREMLDAAVRLVRLGSVGIFKAQVEKAYRAAIADAVQRGFEIAYEEA